MSFRLPEFNLWGRAWRPFASGPTLDDVTWFGPRYFRCQMRLFDHWAPFFNLEVPKGSAFFPYNLTPFGLGMRVQLAGWEYHWAHVRYVSDVASGFDNEHRTLVCVWPSDDTFNSEAALYIARSNPDLTPPEGYEAVQTYIPFDDWADPDMGTDAWNTAV